METDLIYYVVIISSHRTYSYLISEAQLNGDCGSNPGMCSKGTVCDATDTCSEYSHYHGLDLLCFISLSLLFFSCVCVCACACVCVCARARARVHISTCM